ncbi:MAG: hypothetical protein ACJ76N_02555 [Thermoanaerobaculia bacterium]
MRLRLVTLAGALVLSFLAMTDGARASGCSTTYCATAREECLSGCPCATFYCDPASCSSECVCPIVCL